MSSAFFIPADYHVNKHKQEMYWHRNTEHWGSVRWPLTLVEGDCGNSAGIEKEDVRATFFWAGGRVEAESKPQLEQRLQLNTHKIILLKSCRSCLNTSCHHDEAECVYMYLYMVDLQHGEKFIKARTEHWDGGRLNHSTATRGGAMQPSQERVVRPVGGLGTWKGTRHCD